MLPVTICIDDELQARVAAAAERTGKTAEVFILEAIAASVEQVELESNFHEDARERWAKILATGENRALG